MKIVLQSYGSKISVAKFIQLPTEEQVNEVTYFYVLRLTYIYISC